nr:MAG TPA: hypothetical protein [Bacteriophage sp.]
MGIYGGGALHFFCAAKSKMAAKNRKHSPRCRVPHHTTHTHIYRRGGRYIHSFLSVKNLVKPS